MQLKIIPLNVVEENVYTQLFPPDGDYVTWIRANNPDYPEFEASNVKVHLYHLKEDEWPHLFLTVPKTYESLIREHLRSKDGFGDYNTVYLEVDIELLHLYILKKTSIVRGPRSQGQSTIHIQTKLDDDTLIKDWVEVGMPEPWVERNLQRKV